MRQLLLAGTAAALFTPAFASAQPTSSPPAETTDETGAQQQSAPSDDYHSDDDSAIVVTGFPRSQVDILTGTSVVSGDELSRELRPTIGETLARQPGVSATSFGPNASRPVLRGFQGERVRIMTDGIGSLDASNTSVDHAVAINPLTADRIEVLRGPSALLFGSSAIGGVVNVVDSRIPRRLPGEPVHVEGILTYGSAASERSANATVDVPVAGRFVFHLDGNYSKSDDLRIGGFVLTPELRAAAAASPDPEIRDLATLRDRLPNTGGRTSDVAAGVAWVDGANNVGFSVNRYDSLYGVPLRYSLDPAIETEATRIDVAQTRVDGRAEINTGDGLIESVRLRGGYSDYRHFELEETGAVGTTFASKGHEVRLEARQATRGGWGGGFGVQYFGRSLDVVGAEKFLPRNRSRQLGLFALETIERGPLNAEGGLRFEHSNLHADADADFGNPLLNRSFDTWSGSLGGSFGLSEDVRIGLNATRSARAPAAEELFANGPHAGTQAFERGDPDLGTEKSWGIEASLRGSGPGYSFSAAIYQDWFSGYIYEQRTGAFQDDLPVFQYLQDDARYFGVELEGSMRLARVHGVTLNLDGVADYVRATIDSAGPAPRIPPFRILAGLEAQSDRIDGRVEVEKVASQDRLALLETPTDGFTMVNASLAFRPFTPANRSSVTLSANNLFDVDARRHASFLKDYAPLAGRDLRVTARVSF